MFRLAHLSRVERNQALERVYRAKDRAANGDIDADRDNRLKRLLGSKRSQTVIERANRSARYMFRDWGGGRGGR